MKKVIQGVCCKELIKFVQPPTTQKHSKLTVIKHIF